MSKVILLDAGHGGIINGSYVTSGKRSPKWADGSQYFEGVGNRIIRRILAAMLVEAGIPYHFVSTGNEDVDLDDRVAIINAHCRAYGAKNCLLVSIHSNGFKKESAHGWEVFTSLGQTASDSYATILFNEMRAVFPHRNYRMDKKDGDVDKEANFYIIANSACPAILSENWFHTNEDECKNILMNPEGQYKIALAHFNMIQKAISQ
ncbi:MAG: N-acetylmuramoyl-L-alanine amidase [Bacteroidetes bacterium]|nr:N-acetylmuramoyl-L-alanine amidase [Bacteroidota bacterium]